jgi:DNA replication protein DnaC
VWQQGQAAIEAGHHVSWFSLEALGSLLHRHRADDTVARAIKEIMRADLVVIDDIDLLPVSADTAEALYRVVDAAYEARSLAISSNLHPSGFDELMPKTIANATVDRLMHHAHVVLTGGDSIRLTQATRGKGVKPLAD